MILAAAVAAMLGLTWWATVFTIADLFASELLAAIVAGVCSLTGGGVIGWWVGKVSARLDL